MLDLPDCPGGVGAKRGPKATTATDPVGGLWGVLIAEDQNCRYVQVLAFEDGSLIAEVVSNKYLEDTYRWTRTTRKGSRPLAGKSPAERATTGALLYRRSCPTYVKFRCSS